MWAALALVVGLLYGWLTPGRQDKRRLLVQGLVLGLILGLILALLGASVGSNPVHFGSGLFAIVLGVVVITLLFILGVWLGDLVETKPRRST